MSSHGGELLPNLHTPVNACSIYKVGFRRDTGEQHMRRVCVRLFVHRSTGQIGQLVRLLRSRLFLLLLFWLTRLHRHRPNIVVTVVFFSRRFFGSLHLLLFFLLHYSHRQSIPNLLLVLCDLDCHRQSLNLFYSHQEIRFLQPHSLCLPWVGFSSCTPNPAALSRTVTISSKTITLSFVKSMVSPSILG